MARECAQEYRTNLRWMVRLKHDKADRALLLHHGLDGDPLTDAALGGQREGRGCRLGRTPASCTRQQARQRGDESNDLHPHVTPSCGLAALFLKVSMELVAPSVTPPEAR